MTRFDLDSLRSAIAANGSAPLRLNGFAEPQPFKADSKADKRARAEARDAAKRERRNARRSARSAKESFVRDGARRA